MNVDPPILVPKAPGAIELMSVAQRLEASFLSEMLKSAGLGSTPQFLGGGTGEDQFTSFLRHEQARTLAESGSFGLAETIFNSLIGDVGK